MMTAEDYVVSVVEQMPRGTPLRRHTAEELRAHIGERVAGGATLEDVLRQLGDPERLAVSYLAEVPLENAGIGARVAAKIIDFGVSLLIIVPLIALCYWMVRPPAGFPILIWLCVAVIVVGGMVLSVYTTLAEYRNDATIGKRLMGCRVVRESGTRISLGQSMVRHLPFVFQVIWVDAFFALFTERNQRAFELLSRTRVVRVPTEEAA